VRPTRPLLAALLALAAPPAACGDDADDPAPTTLPPGVTDSGDGDGTDEREMQTELPPEDPTGRTEDTVDLQRPAPDDTVVEGDVDQNPGPGG
jgi:hypothetical protein